MGRRSIFESGCRTEQAVGLAVFVRPLSDGGTLRSIRTARPRGRVVIAFDFGKYALVILDRPFVRGLGIAKWRLPSRSRSRRNPEGVSRTSAGASECRGQRNRRCGGRACRDGGDAGAQCIEPRFPSRRWAAPGTACEPRIIEPLSDVSPCGKQEPFLSIRDGCKPLAHIAGGLDSHSSPQHNHVPRKRPELAREILEMVLALGSEDR